MSDPWPSPRSARPRCSPPGCSRLGCRAAPSMSSPGLPSRAKRSSAGRRTVYACRRRVTAIAHMAALTRRVRLAIGVIVLPQRQPLPLAKQLASIDDRRIGVGYVEPELRALGFAGRGPTSTWRRCARSGTSRCEQLKLLPGIEADQALSQGVVAQAARHQFQCMRLERSPSRWCTVSAWSPRRRAAGGHRNAHSASRPAP